MRVLIQLIYIETKYAICKLYYQNKAYRSNQEKSRVVVNFILIHTGFKISVKHEKNPVIKKNFWLNYLLGYLSAKVSWSVDSVILAFCETILICCLLKVRMSPPNCLDMYSNVPGSLTQFVFYHTFIVKPSVLYYINYVFLIPRILNLYKLYISLVFFYSI